MSATTPDAIEKLCNEHDQVMEDVTDRAQSLIDQAGDANDREAQQELAGALDDIASDLQDLLDAKNEAGYFRGAEDAAENARDRAEHLRSDHRRLINDVRAVAREFRTGKPSKARRQLTAWLTKFKDAADRESRHVSELWSNP